MQRTNRLLTFNFFEEFYIRVDMLQKVIEKPVIMHTMLAYHRHQIINGKELFYKNGFQGELKRIAEDNHIVEILKIVKD